MDPIINQSDIIVLIGQRTNEINTWIMVRNIIWTALLLAAFWQISEAIKANNKWHWVLIGCICITWVCFEASCAYYLHVNGAQNDRLEKLLSQPKIGHEYSRMLEITEDALLHFKQKGIFCYSDLLYKFDLKKTGVKDSL